MNKKRTIKETIDYLRMLSNEFAAAAARENDEFKRGKAEAYELAAFELEHNI